MRNASAPLTSGPVRSLALVVNRSKAGAMDIADGLAGQASARGIPVRLSDEFPLPADFLRGADTCCAIGGDGTLLGTVASAVASGVRIVGVNVGKLGFLVTFSPEEIRSAFGRILDGEGVISRRTVIEARTSGGLSALALNDVVIKERGTRLLELEVTTAGHLVSRYSCDGLILSTPSGSTAYSLSAGGPVLHPETDAMGVTPICPHTLNNRSLILPGTIPVDVRVLGDTASPLVSVDGQLVFGDLPSFPLTVGIYRECLSLLHLPGYNYFHTLRTKLHWV